MPIGHRAHRRVQWRGRPRCAESALPTVTYPRLLPAAEPEMVGAKGVGARESARGGVARAEEGCDLRRCNGREYIPEFMCWSWRQGFDDRRLDRDKSCCRVQ